MNLAGLGYLAGGVNQGFDSYAKRRLEELSAQAQQSQMQGDTTLGKALIQAYGGTSAAPQPTPQLSGLSQIGQSSGASPPAMPPQAPGNQFQRPPAPAMPPAAAPQAPAQPQPAPQAPPQAAAGAPSGPTPQQAAAIKQLDFPALVQLIAKSGAPPAAVAQAMEKLVPFMNAQALQQYRMTMMQLAPQRLAETQRHDQATEGASAQRIDQGQQRIDISKDREARLTGQFSDNLKIAKEKLALAESSSDKHIQQTALTDAEREKQRAETLMQNEMIYGGSDPDAEKKKAKFQAQLDDAQKRIDDVRERIAKQPDNWEGKGTGRAPPQVVLGKRVDTTGAKAQPIPPEGMAKAKAAIASGIPKEAVIKQLQDNGFDTTGL